MSNLNYVAQSDCAKSVEPILSELSNAHHQWNTYAEVIGGAYTGAFEQHEKVLNQMKEHRRINSEAMYFLFSCLTAGLAGGLVGGLMAPWIKQAGKTVARSIEKDISRIIYNDIESAVRGAADVTAAAAVQAAKDAAKAGTQTIVRESVRGISQELAKKYSGKIPEWLGKSGDDSSDPFTPNTKSPLKYAQDMKAEIGICFSVLKEDIKDFQISADVNRLPTAVGEKTLSSFRSHVILQNQPTTDDLLIGEQAAIEAELGMWIAWSMVRDTQYWRSRVDALSDGLVSGNDWLSYANFNAIKPVLNRLDSLGVSSFVTIAVTKTDQDANIPKAIRGPNGQYESVLDIFKLQQLGKRLPTPFLNKVADVVINPRYILPSLPADKPLRDKNGFSAVLGFTMKTKQPAPKMQPHVLK